MNLQTQPNEQQLLAIKQWLYEENERLQEGFFRHWDMIEKSFREHELAVLEAEGKTVGFCVWTDNDCYAAIDIMEIDPSFRNKGLGRIFYEKMEEFLRSKNFKAIKLFCAPAESEPFWRQMGFLSWPNRGYSEHALTYYKPIIAYNVPTTEDVANKLELWQVEPFAAKGNSPTWTWEIIDNQKTVVQPCNSNWNLRLTLGGVVVKEEKVKYFFQDHEMEIDPFLIIENSFLRKLSQ